MKTLSRSLFAMFLIIGAVLLPRFPGQAGLTAQAGLSAQSSLPASGPVYIIPIQGDIEASTPVFVQRRVREALANGASSIIFSIDTFGGRVDAALRVAAIIGSIQETRTIAFIGGGQDSMGVSWSAGALIALSCAEIYMAPGTSIGAAAPVMASPDGSMESAGEKTVSAVRAQMAALAEKNGHPPSLALAMVDADVELIEAEVAGTRMVLTPDEYSEQERQNPGQTRKLGSVIERGKLLSLTAGEAERYGLTAGTVGSIDALTKQLGSTRPAGETPVITLQPGPADAAIVFLTSAAAQSILILIGLIALFIEINSPGFGLPGSIAIIAFVILFGSNMFMGTVGSLELILFILGIGLLVVEIFVLPGFGIAGISGLAVIVAALILSMQDFIFPEAAWQWDLFLRNAGTVGAGVILGILGIGLLVAFGPRLRLFDGLTLKTQLTDTASGRPETLAASIAASQLPAGWPQLDDQGVAVSVLRPAGRANFNGHILSVETDGLFVEAGTRLRATGYRGGVVVVTPAEDAPVKAY